MIQKLNNNNIMLAHSLDEPALTSAWLWSSYGWVCFVAAGRADLWSAFEGLHLARKTDPSSSSPGSASGAQVFSSSPGSACSTSH